MARVFLSSATEDRPAMRRLAEALRRAGHEPWIDVDWVGVNEVKVGGAEIDDLAIGDAWLDVLKHLLERTDALIIGHSWDTERSGLLWHHIDAFWTAAAAGKPAFVVRLDHAPLPRNLIGSHVFDLHRDSWDRDVELLTAMLARPTSSFVDREPELAWLARHLETGGPVVVIGDPGMGKTALAVEYARRHAAKYPGGYQVLRADEVGVAQRTAHERPGPNEPSLLIVDEVTGDTRAWLDRLRDGASHSIITTRTRPTELPGAVLELRPLSQADSAVLFESRAGPAEDPADLMERNQTVTAAGGNPGVLVWAANLYRRGWRPSGAAPIALLATTAPPGSPERALLEGTLAFADRAVPTEWAALAGKVEPQTEAVAVAQRLEAAGLARLGPDPDTLTVHPLAREALRNQVAPEAWPVIRARAEEIATRWMMNALARKIVPDDPALEHVEALAGDDDHETRGPWHGALQERLAAFHRRRGDQARELRLLERAKQTTARHRAAYGDLHAIVAAQLASLASEKGNLDGARQALAEAITAAQSQAPDGSVRWRDVDPEAYREALDAAIDTAEILGDPDSEARAVFLLADFHGRRGAWERAAMLAEQALRAARRASEPDLIARAYRLQADAALHGSRYEDARASYEEAIRRLDELGAEELAATTRLLYVNLLLQLNRREAAVRHAERLRGYLAHAPAGWPYHAEAAQTLRMFDGSTTEGEE